MKKTYSKKQIQEAIKHWQRKLMKMNESSYGWDPPKKIQKFCTVKDLYYELRKCKFQGFGNGKCDIPVVVGQNETPTNLQPGPADFHVFFTGEWTDEQIEDMINRDEGNPGDPSVEARINTIESEYDAEQDRDEQLVEVYYSDAEWQAKKPHYVTRIDWNADTFVLVTT